MVREICRDPIFLAQPSAPAAEADLPAAADLLDTLRAHADECVGMAANMIGVSRRRIAFIMAKFGKNEMILMAVPAFSSSSF